MKKTDRDRDIQTDSSLHKVTHKYTNSSWLFQSVCTIKNITHRPIHILKCWNRLSGRKLVLFPFIFSFLSLWCSWFIVDWLNRPKWMMINDGVTWWRWWWWWFWYDRDPRWTNRIAARRTGRKEDKKEGGEEKRKSWRGKRVETHLCPTLNLATPQLSPCFPPYGGLWGHLLPLFPINTLFTMTSSCNHNDDVVVADALPWQLARSAVIGGACC